MFCTNIYIAGRITVHAKKSSEFDINHIYCSGLDDWLGGQFGSTASKNLWLTANRLQASLNNATLEEISLGLSATHFTDE